MVLVLVKNLRGACTRVVSFGRVGRKVGGRGVWGNKAGVIHKVQAEVRNLFGGLQGKGGLGATGKGVRGVQGVAWCLQQARLGGRGGVAVYKNLRKACTRHVGMRFVK